MSVLQVCGAAWYGVPKSIEFMAHLGRSTSYASCGGQLVGNKNPVIPILARAQALYALPLRLSAIGGNAQSLEQEGSGGGRASRKIYPVRASALRFWPPAKDACQTHLYDIHVTLRAECAEVRAYKPLKRALCLVFSRTQ